MRGSRRRAMRSAECAGRGRSAPARRGCGAGRRRRGNRAPRRGRGSEPPARRGGAGCCSALSRGAEPPGGRCRSPPVIRPPSRPRRGRGWPVPEVAGGEASLAVRGAAPGGCGAWTRRRVFEALRVNVMVSAPDDTGGAAVPRRHARSLLGAGAGGVHRGGGRRAGRRGGRDQAGPGPGAAGLRAARRPGRRPPPRHPRMSRRR